MKTLLDSLLLEITLRPELGRLISALLISSGMITGTLLIARLLRQRSAAARSMLWRVCMAGLLVLALWQLSPKVPMSVQVEMIEPVMVVAEPRVVSMPSVVIPPQPPPAAWERALSLISRHGHDVWLFGAGLMLALQLVRQTLGLRRMRKSALGVSAEVEQVAAEVANSLDLPEHSFVCHRVAGLGSPLLTGGLQARVWLPAEAENWPAERLRAVFQHELAHLKRHDLRWQMLAMLAGCLWWWQPLVRLASRALRAEAEEAADDVAVMRTNGAAADYARTLVEIAAGWEPGQVPAAPGLAMYGSRENLQKRVRALLRENRWRGRVGFVALVVIAVAGLLLLGLASARLDFSPPKQTYTSLAKVVAGGRIVSNEGAVNWNEQLGDFYGTIIETLESAEMKKRAMARVHALRPDLKDSHVDIRVAQTKGSAIFNVFATGTEPKFIKIFLDALLDEFIAFRQQIREQGLERSLNNFTETVVKKGKELDECTEKLEAFRRAHDTLQLSGNHNALTEKLTRLRARRTEAELRLNDVAVVQTSPETALRNLERGFTADGTGRLEAGRGLTQAEQSYLKAHAEAFTLQQELEFMKTSAKTADAAAFAELDQRAAKARHLVASWSDAIQQQVAQEGTILKAQMKQIEAEIAVVQKEALEAASQLAEHERLEEEFKATKLAHDRMYEKVEEIQAVQQIQTDYVAIQERASMAYMDIQKPGIPLWKLWAKKAEVKG